jgi:hypothetical protein
MSNELAKEIFDAGVEAGDSRDTIIVEMVKQGLTLNTAQIRYKEFAQDAGLSSPRVGYKAEALSYLQEVTPDILDEEVRIETRAELQEKFGVATSTANDYIKAYAEEAGIELPKSNFGSNPEETAQIFDWIVANKDTDKPAFVDFMKNDMGRSPGSIDETWRGVVLARKLQAAGVVFAEEVSDAA